MSQTAILVVIECPVRRHIGTFITLGTSVVTSDTWPMLHEHGWSFVHVRGQRAEKAVF